MAKSLQNTNRKDRWISLLSSLSKRLHRTTTNLLQCLFLNMNPIDSDTATTDYYILVLFNSPEHRVNCTCPSRGFYHRNFFVSRIATNWNI